MGVGKQLQTYSKNLSEENKKLSKLSSYWIHPALLKIKFSKLYIQLHTQAHAGRGALILKKNGTLEQNKSIQFN